MTKLFIIPGFTHKASDQTYAWLKKELSDKYEIDIVSIDWKRKVMSDYVAEFLAHYQANKAQKNYILGFSFGAMIALLTAQETKPDKLFLCSLSPYFKEDLPKLKTWWKNFMGKRRMLDFKQHSARNAAQNLRMPTTVFIGGKEAMKYPQLLNRCTLTSKNIKQGKLITAPNAPHDIAHPNYQAAIIKELL